MPNAGMAVIMDICDPADLHPRNKQGVGWRLARHALALNYGKKRWLTSVRSMRVCGWIRER
ncbi:hypothetical protein [Paraflavitalea speifideaquila]|uniref:hypothetical protein n=1 Tax=Paraflavitalea speifideaquila TaxID=3076558 RepID=UPI0028E8C702|nr:hypothetical protein [Paraflavitalea speifideiaquila]